jgi:hypothetical protein
MTHPDRDRLTAWVHGFADADLDAHLPTCAECRDSAAALQEEARLLSREIGNPERLAALKAGLLQAAGGSRRPLRGLLWQIPVAAAALFGLVAVLLFPGSRHRVLDGRVALEDGRVVEAPVELAAQQTWQLQAVGKASVRLADRSTVDLSPGARIALAPNGARGVQADLASGEASFAVASDAKRLIVCSPAGRVEAAGGKFSMRIVFEEGGIPVKNALAGAIVTVFAGSISLSNANGTVEAAPGQSAVLAKAEAPLLLSSPQDKQEELLRRLEELAARVARLEAEVAEKVKLNTQLKAQLGGGNPGPGGAVWTNGGGAWTVNPQGGGVRVVTSGAGGGVGGTVIIEEKVERKADPNKEK